MSFSRMPGGLEHVGEMLSMSNDRDPARVFAERGWPRASLERGLIKINLRRGSVTHFSTLLSQDLCKQVDMDDLVACGAKLRSDVSNIWLGDGRWSMKWKVECCDGDS